MINFSSRLFAEELAALALARIASSDADAMKGIAARVEKTRYGRDRVTVTIEFTEAGVDRAKVEFERAAMLVGLKPEHYGASIQLQDGEWFTIAGISLNRPKFPIDIKRTRDGKMFKLTEAGALRALGGAK